MVTIRLSRRGARKRPFYAVLVADQRRPIGGRFIERVGYFNPLARGGETRLNLNTERLQHWITQGAKPSPRVAALYKQAQRAEQ